MKLSMGSVPAHYVREKGADAIAVRTGGETMSWGQLEERSTRRAWALKMSGVDRDDLVTLALANSNAFFEWTFAIWKLGATPHLVSPRLPGGEMQPMLQLAQPKAVIASEAELLNGLDALPVAWGLEEGRDQSLPDVTGRYWRAMSSGGSTGRPKIIVDHRESSVDLATTYARLSADDIVLNPGPLYHSAPFNMSHNALFKGLPLISMPKFDAEETLALIEQWHVTSINMVPTMMQRIWRLPEDVRARYDISSLTNVWHMAAPMPGWLKEAWIEWVGPDHLFEAYGGSERIGAAIISGSEWLQRRGSVGRPADCEAMVVDEEGKVLPAGEIGEILFKSNTRGATFHYIGSENRDWDGGFRSLGDYGWQDEDGYLYLSDRRTDMIISGGVNIFPAEVENALMQHPAVQVAVVIGLPDDDFGARVHAIVQPEAGFDGRLDADELKAFLADKLVRYKLPRSFEIVTIDLRNDAGKVNRPKLRQDRINAAGAEPGAR